jgi:adenine C2-methylase RlmN of 23S rRNA A2503 and tRNA A37/predicted MPP superfamily phosphohydrolase
VHLSDIHFKTKNESSSNEQIRDALLEYLQEIHEKRNCDAVFITGDFRYGPDKNDTTSQAVIDYVKQIANVLKLKENQVVIVPGNHDIDWSDLRDMIIDSVRKSYKADNGYFDEEMMSDLTRNFKFFKSIQTVFNKGLDYRQDIDNIDNPHGIIELDKCSILLLNTAITAGKQKKKGKRKKQERDEGQLIIGSKYLLELLKKRRSNKPLIAIGHHSLDMLLDDENQRVSHILVKYGAKLYLCGHAHMFKNYPFGKQNQKQNQKQKDQGQVVVVGCLRNEENVTVGFSVGTLFNNGDVTIDMHKWDNNPHIQSWYPDNYNSEKHPKLYSPYKKPVDNRPSLTNEPQFVESEDFGISLVGSHQIGRDIVGRKYVWKKNSSNFLFESITLNQKEFINPNPEDSRTSLYSISTCVGCQLATFNSQCVFCEVGTNNFYPLTADEIALQCIFMAEYDSNCQGFRRVQKNKREFAFMGQGEPGFNYPMVKRAILLTDLAMKEINQTVSQYVIYTSGITDFIPSLIDDYKNEIFNIDNLHVSVHFSLNAIEERDTMMPINKLYPYEEFIQQCKALYQVTKEKIEVGILLIAEYSTNDGLKFTLDPDKYEAILGELDANVFRIQLCLVNKTKMGTKKSESKEEEEEAEEYREKAIEHGFECTISGSPADDNSESACGQITTKKEELRQPTTSKKHYSIALELLEKAKEKLYNMSTNLD